MKADEPVKKTRSSDRVLAGPLVGAICALELTTMGRAVSMLVVALVISFAIWLTRSVWGPPNRVLPFYIVAVLVQCAHLIEEYRTGFYELFPPLFGVEPWPAQQFLAFNIAWLALFAIAGVGIARGNRLSYIAALFLAIGGGIANGVAHLGISARAGAYFPGTYTGALALVAGCALFFQLIRRPAIA